MADTVFTPDNLVNVIQDAKDVMSAEIRGESFEENDVPDTWTANKPGVLSLSSRHYKHGSQSLCWQWAQGDSIQVTDIYGLADAECEQRSAGKRFHSDSK